MIQFNLGPTVEDKPFIANSNLFLKIESSLFKKHERIHTELLVAHPVTKNSRGKDIHDGQQGSLSNHCGHLVKGCQGD